MTDPTSLLHSLVSDLQSTRLEARPLSWPSSTPPDVATAYAAALAVRTARIAAGDVPAGYKIGFTNRTIWPRYGVYAPIWGTVWESGLTQVAAGSTNQGALSLAGLCEARIEPEIVFCLREAPPPDCTLAQLVSVLDWMAHGFEIVQSHLPGWKFTAAQAVADGGLHGRLLVGHAVPIHAGTSAGALMEGLTGIKLKLYGDGNLKDEGVGANVLDGPLQALLYFVQELRALLGAPLLKAGDLITTGTLTDAYPVSSGETWHTEITSSDALVGRLEPLTVRFE